MMMQTGNVGGEEVRGDEGVFSGMMFDGKGMKVIKMRRLSRVITRHVDERRYA
jgi:hypothetical protein